MEEYFETRDNVLDKCVDVFIEAHHFRHRKNIGRLTNDIVMHVAHYFTNGDEHKAKSLLKGDEDRAPRTPLMIIMFFGGGIVLSSIIMIMLLSDEEILYNHHFDEETNRKFYVLWDTMSEKTPLFRFTMACILILFGASVCIHVFRKYEINYFHIFQLDYKYQIQEYKMAAIGMILAAIWFLVYYLNIILLVLEGYTESETDEDVLKFAERYDYIGVGMMIFLLLICFNPFDCFYRTARKELGWTICQILIAPFGSVRFRDFFFADVLTSITTPLADMGFIVLHFGNISNDYVDEDGPYTRKDMLYPWLVVIAFLPFWWRFWQCIRKAYKNTNYW